MKSKMCFLGFQMLTTLLLFCEDAVQPTIKKEKIPILPHVWFSEGVVFLKAKENGLACANQSQDVPTTTDFLSTLTLPPHFEWNGGLQINMGYQPKNVFFFATWTYIQNKAKSQSFTDGSFGFFPLLSLSQSLAPTTYVTSGNMSWKLDTHLGDIGTIFSWHPKKYFILKNQIGLKIASLNQKLDVHYGGGNFNEGIDTLNMGNHFFGVGPSLGVTPTLVLPRGFSFVGSATGSVLLGGFWVKQQETYLNQMLFYAHHQSMRFRWILDAKVGVAWQKEFLYKALVFCVQAGWEWQEFFHQNEWQYNQFEVFHDSRNILLQGGFLSLCLGF